MIYIILAIVWTYAAIVLALVAGVIGDQRREPEVGRIPFTNVLGMAVLVMILWPFLSFPAFKDWHERLNQ